MSALSGKKVLGIFAHPDDECIFGWPVFQDKTIDRYLFVCCDDSERDGDRRRQALQQVCQKEGIKLVKCLSFPNNFYQTQTRGKYPVLMDYVTELQAALARHLPEIKPDFVFTHNPWGEYGHGTHRFVFDIVVRFIQVVPIIFTDICEWNKCHLSTKELPLGLEHAFLGEEVGTTIFLDEAFWQRCEQVYGDVRGWTWKKGLPENREANLYSVGY